MITLKDSIEIRTTPERSFKWFENIDKNFTKWHPNHKKFVKVTGNLNEGDIIYFEECIDGRWYKIKCKITEIEKGEWGWRVVFKSTHWLGGTLLNTRLIFLVERKKDTCVFSNIQTIGFNAPVIGKLIDLLILKSFSTTINLIKKDMEEDGKNLKKILERD